MTGFFLPWSKVNDQKRVAGKFYFPKRHRAFKVLSVRAVIRLQEPKKDSEPDKKKHFCIEIDRRKA